MKVAQSCPALCYPVDHTVHRTLQATVLEWVAVPFSRDLSNPGIELGSPELQVDSSPAEPPGKPKNTGVGSLSFLQGISLTQESNWGLLHCRRILYQLRHQGSPRGGLGPHSCRGGGGSGRPASQMSSGVKSLS